MPLASLPWRKRLCAVALSACAGVLLACPGGRVETVHPNAPVILISIDTLRSDRLPVYGFTGVATPHLEAFRRDAVLFERAYSHYPLTLPSHASILTGLLPTEHGVRDNVGYRLDTEAHPYLPRLLRERGYTTGAAVSAFVLAGRHSGLATHFDFYDDAIESGTAGTLGGVQRSGAETAAAAREWLTSAQATGKPVFLFLHLYEPHTPYDPPEPFRSRYPDRYLGEVAATDEIVGQFLADLKARGLYDPALILVLSDHGEGLGDHGEAEHGILLYREALQVPLLVKLPGGARAGETVPWPVQLVDVAPTVLATIGAAVPTGLPGRSLLATDDPGERSLYAETYYPRLHYGWSELHSLIAGDDHLISGPDPELYDLKADPAERTNLRDGDRRTFARLRDELRGQIRELAAPAAADAETAAKLAALGYVSSGAGAAASGDLPDPKTQVGLLAEIGRGRRLVEERRFDEAVAVLAAFVAKNPKMADAWTTLAAALTEGGRLSDALAAQQRAIELSGPQPSLVLAAASLLFRMGRLDEAEDHAELALADKAVEAHVQLAEIARGRRDLAAAERHLRAAVAARGSAVAPLLELAKVLAQRNQIDEAKRHLATAEAELARRTSQDPLPNLHFLRGDLALRDGRVDVAVAELAEEIRIYPKNFEAYASLAFAFAFQGRGGESAGVLARMVEEVPSPAAYAAAVDTLRALGDQAQATALLAFAKQRFPGSEVLARL